MPKKNHLTTEEQNGSSPKLNKPEAGGSRKIRVALGMSGGIDSSVAAVLLCKAGYEVIGLTMLIWSGEEPTGKIRGNACYGPGEKEDMKSARETAAQLGIPHYPISLATEYKNQVLDWFRERYLEGVTPNPCAICNPTMKFGYLLDKARSQGIEFDYFATGHYVRRLPPEKPNGAYRLFKGADPDKDQSYFLARLRQSQLASSIFPLGELTKREIRQMAEKLGLTKAAAKKESQDFYEGEDMGELFPPDKISPGPIVDTQGNRVGTHRGIIYYTVGQREGLGVAAGYKVYVKDIQAENNTIVIATRNEVTTRHCIVNQPTWISGSAPIDLNRITVRLRYRHPGVPAKIQHIDDNTCRLEFAEPQFAVTPGQLAAFYNEDEILGGGWIAKSN